MSRTVHPDDCVIQAEPYAAEPVPLDDEERDDGEISGGSADYASLLGLGTKMRNKRPCIVVEPEEAENTARLVQHIAAQQLTGDDDGEIGSFADIIGLVPAELPDDGGPEDDCLTEDDYLEANSLDAEPVVADIARGADNHALEDDEAEVTPSIWADPHDGPALRSDCEDLAEAEPHPNAAARDVTPADELASRVVEPAAPAIEDEPPALALPSPTPPPETHGHSLRRRIPARLPSKSPAHRLVAVLRRLQRWLTL